ncbi:hypothetical protein BK120_23195 [Paenibacillus sp. FSL A5-0031]|uniref:type II secretion system F family protein n=1 Tax=Paenibacillus sp. FSL A5-0031 TaxID=1920420 RepID=UPI00096D9B2B|nr:hypothetical protein [Paenibacillus sp. FSL A5-0031]OME78648.1 hypothetical protein BK120_23195 [Paenibacillus sp. FSL A5-0031]
MYIVKIVFLAIFIIGVILIVGPITGRLAVGLMIFNRNRFYDKRRTQGRALDDTPKSTWENHPLMVKFNEYLSVAEIKVPAKYLFTMCFLIAVVVFLICYRVMPAPLYNAIVALFFATIPLLWSWTRYQRKNLSMASVMIPTVQNFIGYFTESENLEGAIYKASRTVPFEISSEWNKLIMDLQTGENPEKSILQFAERVGNDWAHYFADILITHLDNGGDITPSLFKLINEMQNTMYNEEKRITLLTAYKWGTFLMIVLSVFVVYFNIRMDPKNAHYYFEDHNGIQLVTLSIGVLFASFIGAMQMGTKKL